MPLQHVKLADPQQIAATPGSVYANPVSTKTYLRGFIAHNTNTTAESVRFYVVPDAAGALGTASAANRIVNYSIPANDTLLVSFEYPIILTDTNDAVFAETTTAARVTLILLGDRE